MTNPAMTEKEIYEIIKVQAEEVINMGLFLGIYGFNQIAGAKFPSSTPSGTVPASNISYYCESLSYFTDPKEAAEQESARFIFGMIGGRLVLPQFIDNAAHDMNDTMRYYASRVQTASLVSFLNTTMLHYYQEHPYWFAGNEPFSYGYTYISNGLVDDQSTDITIILPSVFEDQHRPDLHVNGLMYAGKYGLPFFADRVRLEYTYDTKEFYGETKKIPVGLMPAFVIMDAVATLSSIVTTGYLSPDLFQWETANLFKRGGTFADRIDRNTECVQEFYRSSYVEMEGLHSYTEKRSANLHSTMESIEREREQDGSDNLYLKLIPLEFRNAPYKQQQHAAAVAGEAIQIIASEPPKRGVYAMPPEDRAQHADEQAVLKAEENHQTASIEPLEMHGTPLKEDAGALFDHQKETMATMREVSKFIRNDNPEKEPNERVQKFLKAIDEADDCIVRALTDEEVESLKESAEAERAVEIIEEQVEEEMPNGMEGGAEVYEPGFIKRASEENRSAELQNTLNSIPETGGVAFHRPFDDDSFHIESVYSNAKMLDTIASMRQNPKPLRIFARRHDILNDGRIPEADKNREIAKISSMSAAWDKQRQREEIFMQITGLSPDVVIYALHYIGNSTVEEDLMAAGFLIDTYFAVMELNDKFYGFSRAAVTLPSVGMVFNKIVEDHKYWRTADYEDHIDDQDDLGFSYNAVKLYTLSQEVYREARMKGLVGIAGVFPHVYDAKKTLIEELNSNLRIECSNHLKNRGSAFEEHKQKQEKARLKAIRKLEQKEQEEEEREKKMGDEDENMTKIINENITGMVQFPHDAEFARLMSEIILPIQAVFGIARIAYEQNRVFAYGIGEHNHNEEISPAWDKLNGSVQLSIAKRVCEIILYGESNPAKNHAIWMESKQNDGWTYGEVKDNAKKTHPALRPYNELPARTKVKDVMFLETVKSLAGRIAEYSIES